MVIIDMDFNILIVRQPGEFPDAAFLPGIYQDESLDMIQINLSYLGEVEEVGYGINEEIAEVFFL